HVLEEMRESRFANLLPCRSHMVGHVHMYHRVTVILMHDQGEAIGEDKLRVGNDDLPRIGFDAFNEPRLGAMKERRQGYERDDKQRRITGIYHLPPKIQGCAAPS